MWHDAQAERGARRRVTVVRDRGVFVGGVALQADAVAGRAKFRAVRLVAIAAGDAGREHLALLERAVVVDLVAHLPVGIIEPAGERRDHVGVREPAARHPVLGKFAAARVAQAAGLDLLANEGRREVALRVAGARIAAPHDIPALVESNEQPHFRVFALAERPPALLRACPADMRDPCP